MRLHGTLTAAVFPKCVLTPQRMPSNATIPPGSTATTSCGRIDTAGTTALHSLRPTTRNIEFNGALLWVLSVTQHYSSRGQKNEIEATTAKQEFYT
eukprot:m.747942 g.747942  ORF g.747942 m.747942 type:complete len:96 (-) comp23148_c0_seq6:1195-1482(-)